MEWWFAKCGSVPSVSTTVDAPATNTRESGAIAGLGGGGPGFHKWDMSMLAGALRHDVEAGRAVRSGQVRPDFGPAKNFPLCTLKFPCSNLLLWDQISRKFSVRKRKFGAPYLHCEPYKPSWANLYVLATLCYMEIALIGAQHTLSAFAGAPGFT